MNVSFDDMIECARRELSMRRKLYPRWVQRGKMSREEADREITVMTAIVTQLEKDAGRNLL